MSDARAPIDPGSLRPVLAPTLGASRTLPAAAYISPAVFAWEERALLRGRLGLRRPGRRPGATGRPARVPGGGGGHAAGPRRARPAERLLQHVPAPGSRAARAGHEHANLRAIKCPYHAWVYGLDGSLNGAPRFGDVPGFDKADYPLIAARVAEWHGWVFVNASGDAPALDEYVGNLDELDRAVGDRADVRGGIARLRDRRELEDDHRELPRVLPLPDRSTRRCAW